MAKSTADRVLLALMGVALAGFFFIIRDSFVQRVVEQGDKAPSFRSPPRTDRRFPPPTSAAKLLVLNFWATWCPPCVEETPSLSEFAKAMQKDGIVVVAVSVDKNEAAYKRFPAAGAARVP